jgi:hypothetical protein
MQPAGVEAERVALSPPETIEQIAPSLSTSVSAPASQPAAAAFAGGAFAAAVSKSASTASLGSVISKASLGSGNSAQASAAARSKWKVAKLKVTSVVAVAKPKLNAMNTAYDIRGRKYDLRELRKQRLKAVMKAMTWMEKFLRKDKYQALKAIGDDAPNIFFEIWYTSADSRVRVRAKGIATEMLEKYEKHLLCTKLKGRTPTRDDFFEFMFLLRNRNEMDQDSSKLLAVAQKTWKNLGFADTDELFGQNLADLDSIDTDSWLDLLMNVLIMEYNKIIFRGCFPLKWGMREVFHALKKHELKLPPYDDEDRFHQSIYLATHIVFALSAYSSIKTDEKEVPWLYKYCRAVLRWWMNNAKKNDGKLKKKKKEAKEAEEAEEAESKEPEGGDEEDEEEEGEELEEELEEEEEDILKKLLKIGAKPALDPAAVAEEQAEEQPQTVKSSAADILGFAGGGAGGEVHEGLRRAQARRRRRLSCAEAPVACDADPIVEGGADIDDEDDDNAEGQTKEGVEVADDGEDDGEEDGEDDDDDDGDDDDDDGDDEEDDGNDQKAGEGTTRSYQESVRKAAKEAEGDDSEEDDDPRTIMCGYEPDSGSSGIVKTFVDIDGVAECVDVLRGAGLTEGCDRLLCEGVRWLLDMQNKDGSWNYVSHYGHHLNKKYHSGPAKDFYSLIHPTWVASQALRDRDYKIERRGNVLWKDYMDKLVVSTKFAELDYTPKWSIEPMTKQKLKKAMAKGKGRRNSLPGGKRKSLVERNSIAASSKRNSMPSVGVKGGGFIAAAQASTAARRKSSGGFIAAAQAAKLAATKTKAVPAVEAEA